MVNTLILIAIVAVLLPYVVFACVKFGTYAYYKGRQVFIEEGEDYGSK